MNFVNYLDEIVVLSTHLRRARKDHRCTRCLAPINSGTRYLDCKLVVHDEGHLQERFHQDCATYHNGHLVIVGT